MKFSNNYRTLKRDFLCKRLANYIMLLLPLICAAEVRTSQTAAIKRIRSCPKTLIYKTSQGHRNRVMIGILNHLSSFKMYYLKCSYYST